MLLQHPPEGEGTLRLNPRKTIYRQVNIMIIYPSPKGERFTDPRPTTLKWL